MFEIARSVKAVSASESTSVDAILSRCLVQGFAGDKGLIIRGARLILGEVDPIAALQKN